MRKAKVLLLLALTLAFRPTVMRAGDGTSQVQQAKTDVVTGRVLDAKGEPIVGATILKKSTTIGTITDMDGNFSLSSVSEGDVLVVSFIGYVKKEVKASSSAMTITMQEDMQMMSEVVVVGYGVQKKSDVTGSVASVKAEELRATPVPGTAQALQGRVAGVVVQNTSGDPSGDVPIRIRGANSLTYGNDPLIIIDGVQDANIGSLNPNQIESMEILKDAAALSVYGSRGANGVILITTKSGKEGKAQISYNGFISFDQVIKKLPWLRAKDYATLMNEAQRENGLTPMFVDADIPSLGDGTNWQDELFRNTVSHVHNISIGGAREKISYFLAGGISSKEGNIIKTNFDEYTFRANLKAEATKRLTMSFNAFASYSKSKKGDTEGALTSALQWSPTKSVYDEDGLYTQPGGGIGPVSLYNPVGLAREILSEDKQTKVSLSLGGEYKFTDWIKFSSMLVYKTNSTTSGWFDNQIYNNGPEEDIAGSKTNNNYNSLQNTNILTFDKDFNGHHLQATAVYEFVRDKYESTQASAKGIPAGMGYQGVHFGTVLQKPWIESVETTLESIMGRVNYSYKNRYMLSGSYRRDGASQLADGHKWDNFWAVSGGWNITEENFMESVRKVLSSAKIRASYGLVGNAAVPAFSSHMKFTPGTDANGDATLAVSQLENKDLKWERTKEFSIGLDTRLFDDRITFVAEYYDKKTSDLLVWRTVPSALGVSTALTNVGEVTNKGWEFTLGGYPVKAGDFSWNINWSINFNRNKIITLDGINDRLINSGNVDMPGLVGSYVQMVGEPMGTFLGYKYAGVWKQEEISTAAMYGAKPGDAKYVDVDHNGVIDKEDIVIIGNAQPKFSYGINNTFHWRNLDLNVFFQGVYGNDIYNQNRVRRESYSGGGAFPTHPSIADHWTADKQSETPAFSGSELVNSSRWVEDGSYLRLKNLTLGYSLPDKWLQKIKFNQIRVYATASNLWTITDYSGYDPEASMGMDAYGAGIDRGIYPSSKSWVVGLDITF